MCVRAVPHWRIWIAYTEANVLTRTGLDWPHRYRRMVEALQRVKSAYINGELCALDDHGVPVFSRLRTAMDEGRADLLVRLTFDFLFLDGESTAQLPLVERKAKLKRPFRSHVATVIRWRLVHQAPELRHDPKILRNNWARPFFPICVAGVNSAHHLLRRKNLKRRCQTLTTWPRQTYCELHG